MDQILFEDIDESNEQLPGNMKNDNSGDEVEYVFGDNNLIWEQVVRTSGANTSSYITRASRMRVL